MSETQYSIVYVIDEANGAPRLSYEDRGMASITIAENVLNGTHRVSVGRSEYLWVVKHGTAAYRHLTLNAKGRISSFSRDPKKWLKKVADSPIRHSMPASEASLPGVRGNGLLSTDNGKKIDDLQVTVNNTIHAADLDSYSVALKHMAGGLADGGSMVEPAKPHTTLITQVDVNDVSPINDTLYNALVASGVEGLDGDKFPEDGNITIQWSKVHGRTNLRKFTITVDYKESN